MVARKLNKTSKYNMTWPLVYQTMRSSHGKITLTAHQNKILFNCKNVFCVAWLCKYYIANARWYCNAEKLFCNTDDAPLCNDPQYDFDDKSHSSDSYRALTSALLYDKLWSQLASA